MEKYIRNKHGKWINRHQRDASRSIIKGLHARITLPARFPKGTSHAWLHEFRRAEGYRSLLHGVTVARRYYYLEGDLL